MYKNLLFIIFGTAIATDIILHQNYTVKLTGEITSESISKTIYDIYNINNTNIIIYIDTPGGSVSAGNRLIDTIEHLSLKKLI